MKINRLPDDVRVGAIRDGNVPGLQLIDRLVKVIDLKREMDQIFLHADGAALRKTAQFNEFVTIGNRQKGQMRPARRHLAFQHFQPQHVPIKRDGGFHVTDAHSCVQQFLTIIAGVLPRSQEHTCCGRHISIVLHLTASNNTARLFHVLRRALFSRSSGAVEFEAVIM